MPDASSRATKTVLGFIQDPSAAMDLSCVDQVLPIDFAGQSIDPKTVFGTTSVWQG